MKFFILSYVYIIFLCILKNEDPKMFLEHFDLKPKLCFVLLYTKAMNVNIVEDMIWYVMESIMWCGNIWDPTSLTLLVSYKVGGGQSLILIYETSHTHLYPNFESSFSLFHLYFLLSLTWKGKSFADAKPITFSYSITTPFSKS